jgi:hypothetical protein
MMILLAALLRNYSRGKCLIDVGTEGNVGEKVTAWGARRAWWVRGPCWSSTELAAATVKVIAAAFVEQRWMAVTLLCV